MHSHCTAIFYLTEINTRLYFEYIRTYQDLNFFKAFDASAILHFYNVMDFLIFCFCIANVACKHFKFKFWSGLTCTTPKYSNWPGKVNKFIKKKNYKKFCLLDSIWKYESVRECSSKYFIVYIPETSLITTTLTTRKFRTSLKLPSTYMSSSRTKKSDTTFKEVSLGMTEFSTIGTQYII